MTTTPDASVAALRANFAALQASARDKERLFVWASCGFNAAAASRARPDLGSADTFERTRRRYQRALAGIVAAHLRDTRTGLDGAGRRAAG